ncbi:MATE family efflux transporter [Marinagarivorans algicola]|uniref:MATE family efflux transporter n=1 Tax=Marinagarivorans algicola TaxID=1513270 RepID=UPI0006B925F5|nr:MATE family efflux transporter [Marinagarivorans algicola]
MTDQAISYCSILKRAWPIMLANIALPLLGLIDTAIIGHLGGTQDLAALAIGAIVINFIFWNFGFLRMSTTALSAQAWGQGKALSLLRIGLRALIIASALALCILCLQKPLTLLAMTLLAPPLEALEGASTYLAIRLWGAPITLINYVITGLLIGLSRSKSILVLQITLNSLNAVFDLLLAGVLGLGITGIAYGTVIAEVITVFIGFYILHLTWRQLVSDNPSLHSVSLLSTCWQQLRESQFWVSVHFKKILRSNRDIWIRTFCLLLSFMGFTHFSGQLGANTLAANHLLLQIIAFSAFFLDSFAYVTEADTGKAIGQRSRRLFIQATQKTSVLAAITAIALAGIILVSGPWVINQLTVTSRINTLAIEHLYLCAIYIALSAGAFQLDGIFIGANYGKALRNASITSALLFFILWLSFLHIYGLIGLWVAFISFIVLRALCLSAYWSSLMNTHFSANTP